MYPYRSNTNIYQKNTSINTREASLSVTKQDLKQDKRLLELLEIAQQETIESLSAFEALIKNEALQPDIETLRNAYLDEIKHLKLLQEILYNITGKPSSMQQPTQSTATETTHQNVSSEIEKTLHQEMEQTDFFRELLIAIPETDLRDILFEIITDKQDHCIRLCFLFSKYK
ncbi:ferritin-like domain-containing protein [Clostridium sp. MD294]|uniref:ferritin-like domain-containing protein n=1 Tax=Clostridium sp. MD294 TaxID=97138 RepID=UPI0002C958A8|nr:ferritin-like domain-containing protein [Clostridium sp. MD294]NDO47335.1 ferritin-like domain-containing protein [Clostridium sp. MD294]USF29597.1 hypothetical protein C820_000997 [Clostridium sp. MD294]